VCDVGVCNTSTGNVGSMCATDFGGEKKEKNRSSITSSKLMKVKVDRGRSKKESRRDDAMDH